MVQDGIAEIRSKVEEYCAQYAINPAFAISPLADVHQLYVEKREWPFGSVAGCYAFFSSERELLYVGKADTAIASRTGTYFRWNEDRTSVTPQGIWTKPPTFLQAIKVHKSYKAPSLEAFLIQMLQPPHNVRGIGRISK